MSIPSFEYVLPVIRGIQAGREYYISMCPIRFIPRLFACDNQEVAPEMRARRGLNKTRVPEIARYILNNPNNYTFSVITASIVRNAFFRKEIVQIYDYTCAFCKLKVTRLLTQNIVDGAHIKPFSGFYDSRVANGISLCKNHHWAFDYGWFGISDEYKILVADDLQEESPHAKSMKDFRGEVILLPGSEQYFPSIESLQWHRANVFKDQ